MNAWDNVNFRIIVELLTMFREFADVQTKEMLNLPIPALKDGKPVIISADPSQELIDYVADLVERSEAVRSNRVDPKDDNMLKITNDGRKAALDMRLIDSSLADYPGSKVNLAVENIYRIWDETSTEKLTQLVFCDLSTPTSPGLNLYDDIKNKLVMMGIPEGEISFIHDADTKEKKMKLYEKVKAGIVRILMGSTSKMGAGMNVQNLLYCVHHLDAPWRPRDIEQRDGRILRQGNQNDEVMIFRYVTKNSFDAYLWQILETKARFISQVIKGDTTVRVVEDVDSGALTYAEVKAIASGNPMILEKMTVDTEVQRLQSLRSSYLHNRYKMQDDAKYLDIRIAKLSNSIKNMEDDILTRVDVQNDKFEIEINKISYADRKDAGTALIEIAKEFKSSITVAGKEDSIHVGNYAGFKLFIAYKKNFFVEDDFSVVIRGKTDYKVNITLYGGTLINNLENTVYGIEGEITHNLSEISKASKALKDLNNELMKPFDKEDKLKELLARQYELNALLDRNKSTELLDSEQETA